MGGNGEMKRKLLDLFLAAGVLLLILSVLYLLLGQIGNGPPQVGKTIVSSAGTSLEPLSHECFITQDGKRKEKKRLLPQEAGKEAPTLLYDRDFSVRYEGGSENGGFYFTVYDENFEIAQERRTWFPEVKDPGNYLICLECYWGKEKENIGMEYYFWFQVK